MTSSRNLLALVNAGLVHARGSLRRYWEIKNEGFSTLTQPRRDFDAGLEQLHDELVMLTDASVMLAAAKEALAELEGGD